MELTREQIEVAIDDAWDHADLLPNIKRRLILGIESQNAILLSAGTAEGLIKTSNICIERLEKENAVLKDLLMESHLQIEYLHKKFTPTGSCNSILSRIKSALNL